MEKILSVVKCAICNQIMKSPKILPCFHTFCEMHFSEQTNDVIRCHKCGVEHQIPTNGFKTNYDTVKLIESGLASLNFGGVHKEAKISCEIFENALAEFEVILNDPNVYPYERITDLKNDVQLKAEELKLRIDEEKSKLLDRLEKNQEQCKEYLSTKEFKEESKKFESEMKIAQSKLDSWNASLNK